MCHTAWITECALCQSNGHHHGPSADQQPVGQRPASDLLRSGAGYGGFVSRDKEHRTGAPGPGQQVDLVEARTLWHRAVATSDFSNLGVEVGLRLSPRSTGLLFPLLLHSPSIRTDVELLVRYQMPISQNGLFRVNDISSRSSLLCTYVPARSSVAVHPQHALSVITAALKTLGSISSRRIRASLCLPAGLDAEGISALLQCPVQAAGGLYILELAREGMGEPRA